jgi:hypothetical protein
MEVKGKAMEGMEMTAGMTTEQVAEAQRNFEVMKKAAEEDLWRIACLMASKPNDRLLGSTEFEVRDHVLRIGAKAIETAVNGRKKGGMRGAAPSAGDAGRTPASSGGGRRRS